MKHILKYRKLMIFISLLITSILFIFTKDITFVQWSLFIQYTFAIYVGSLAIDKINRGRKSHSWKSKKLIMYFVLYIASVLMVVFKYADFLNWSQFINWLYGFYSASNISTDMISKGKTDDKN